MATLLACSSSSTPPPSPPPPAAPPIAVAPVVVDAGTVNAAAVASPRHVDEPALPDGGIRIVIDVEPNHLNPDLDPDRWGHRIALDTIYEPLVRLAPDGSYVPVLAERYSVDDGGRRITFHLRRGVKFHDDRPLSPLDVQFTFERLRSSKTHAPRVQAELADLEKVEIGGDVVRIWATRPSAYLLPAIAEIGILPERVFGHGELQYQPANRRPVGTGPFRLRTWERGRRIVLERYAGYWGRRALAPLIEIVIDDDAPRALGRAKRGEVDVLGRVPPAYVAEQLDSPAIRDGYEVVRTQPARFSFVVWNTARAPLDDATVRAALSAALDRGRLVELARHGLGRAITVPPLGLPDAVPPLDLATVERTLDAAGTARDSGNGMRQTRGHPWHLTLLVPTGSHEAQVAGKRIAESLTKVGVTVDVVTTDFLTVSQRLKHGQFDGALLEWTGHDDDDLSPLFRSRGAQNFGGYSDKTVDQLLDALRRTTAADERRALRVRLAAALTANPPALFLYAPEEVFLYSRRLVPVPRLADFLLLRDVARR